MAMEYCTGCSKLCQIPFNKIGILPKILSMLLKRNIYLYHCTGSFKHDNPLNVFVAFKIVTCSGTLPHAVYLLWFHFMYRFVALFPMQAISVRCKLQAIPYI